MEWKQKIRNEKQGKWLNGCKQLLPPPPHFSWSQKCQLELFHKAVTSRAKWPVFQLWNSKLIEECSRVVTYEEKKRRLCLTKTSISLNSMFVIRSFWSSSSSSTWQQSGRYRGIKKKNVSAFVPCRFRRAAIMRTNTTRRGSAAKR